jgi:hypothetical protein
MRWRRQVSGADAQGEKLTVVLGRLRPHCTKSDQGAKEKEAKAQKLHFFSRIHEIGYGTA